MCAFGRDDTFGEREGAVWFLEQPSARGLFGVFLLDENLLFDGFARRRLRRSVSIYSMLNFFFFFGICVYIRRIFFFIIFLSWKYFSGNTHKQIVAPSEHANLLEMSFLRSINFLFGTAKYGNGERSTEYPSPLMC